MGYGYIKTNINAMKFDSIKDRDKIIFKHYIMRKENLNRIQNKLPIGQFMMSISSVSFKVKGTTCFKGVFREKYYKANL